jgi:hypothetical protein
MLHSYIWMAYRMADFSRCCTRNGGKSGYKPSQQAESNFKPRTSSIKKHSASTELAWWITLTQTPRQNTIMTGCELSCVITESWDSALCSVRSWQSLRYSVTTTVHNSSPPTLCRADEVSHSLTTVPLATCKLCFHLQKVFFLEVMCQNTK